MSEIEELREKIRNIHAKIGKMHVTAWRHRVNKNAPALNSVRRRIKSAHEEVSDCETCLEELIAMHSFLGSAVWRCFVVAAFAIVTWAPAHEMFMAFLRAQKQQ